MTELLLEVVVDMFLWLFKLKCQIVAGTLNPNNVRFRASEERGQQTWPLAELPAFSW